MGTPSERSPYQLLVEGSDDKYSVINLMKRHAYDWDNKAIDRPHVRDAGGIDPLLDLDLPKTLAAATYTRVGIVVDADESLEARWAALRGRCQSAGVELPESPDPSGTIVEGGRPSKRVGVWLMPDNTLPGSLEHFLAKLVPPDDACWQRARQAVADAHAAGCAQNATRLKHELHTYLAWHAERPGLPFGTALTAEVLGRDSPEARLFADWFQRLFG